MIRKEETICAPATSSGGAVSMIRISGPLSFDICENIFFPADKNLAIKEQNGFRIFHGEIRDGNELIDDVLLNIYKSPHSYTGEDSVEISCHGSAYIITRILQLLVSKGAVSAQAGRIHSEGIYEWENGSFAG